MPPMYPSNLPGSTLLRSPTGQRKNIVYANPDLVKVRWVDDNILRLGKCILHDSALLLAGYPQATEFDLMFNGLGKCGVTGVQLLECLDRRLPQALVVYSKLSGGAELTPHICKERVDKMYRQDNRPCISREHPYHSPDLRLVHFWMRDQLKKTGGHDKTFHNVDPQEIPAKEIWPAVPRKKNR